MKFYLLSLIIVFCTVISPAQWQPDVRLTNNPAVSQTSFNNAWSITASGDTVHILFFDERNGYYTQIYYKRSVDKGITWGPDTRLTTSTTYAERGSIAVNGSFVHVVWQDWRNPSWEIYYRRSTDGGTTWGVETRLTNDPGNSWEPGVYVLGSVVHVLWSESRDGNMEVYYKRSSDAGTTWGADTRLTNNSADQWYPVCGSSGSIVHVLWTDTRDGNYEVYYKRSTDSGLNWGSDTRLTNTTSYSQNPTVALNGSIVHIAWFDDRDGNFEIYYKKSTDAGLSWGADTRLTNAAGLSANPSLACSGSRIHLTWEDDRDGNNEIYYKRSTNGGVNWTNDTRLTNAPGDSRYASVCFSGAVVHTVWFDERDGNREIYYKRDPTGNSDPPSSITILNHTPSKNALNVSPSANITIQFSASMNVSTLTNNNIRVYGELSGLHPCIITYNSSNNTATLDPGSDFKLGETIEAIVSERVKSTSNDSLLKPYVWRFSIDVLLGFTSFVLDTAISAYNLNGSLLCDLDNDGDLDAAYNSHDNATITILKNNGNGKYSYFATLSGGGMSWATYYPSCGDFNADGHIDLAVPVRFNNIVSIWFNTGIGNFVPVQQVGVDYEPEHVSVADFNGDGYTDLVAVCNNISTFYYDILINDGTGHFTRTQQIQVSNRPDICMTADINGDGAIDILASVSPSSSSNCYVLMNNGYGSFSVVLIPVPNTSYTPTPGDLDGDGDVDLIVNGCSSNATYGMKVLKNNGSGGFSAGQSFGDQSHIYGQKVIKDMNNDGYLDVVATWAQDMEIYFNDGSGNFTLGYLLHANGWAGYSFGVGDVNGNGNLDFGRPDGNDFAIYKAVAPTIPPPPILFSPPNGSINQPTTVRFIWYRSQYAVTYRMQLSTDSLFNTFILNDSTLTDSTIVIANLTDNTYYWWRVNAKNLMGTSQFSQVWRFKTLIVGLEQIGTEMPKEYKLYSSYPNPFNPITKIRFDIPPSKVVRGSVTLKTFDILGREITTLVNEGLKPGTYEVEWDGSNYPSGIYFYKLTAGDFSATKKMLLIK